MLRIVFWMMLGLCLACEGGGSDGPDLRRDAFDFDPVFMGGSSPTDSPAGVPVPPRGFRADPVEGGGVRISWTFPKTYAGSTVGWVIFRKIPVVGEEAAWDFSRTTTEDWERGIFSLAAGDCRGDGYCAVLDPVSGPAQIAYAAVALWDVDNRLSPRSPHVTAAVGAPISSATLVFGDELMEKPPSHVLGATVAEADRKPGSIVFNLSDGAPPWFRLDASQADSAAPKWARIGSPIFPGIDPRTGLDLVLPDPGFFRAIKLSKGKETDCDGLDGDIRTFCEELMMSRPLLTQEFLGQQTANYGLEPASNPLPESRKFLSRAASVEIGPSGRRYFFIADEARVLVRADEVYGCGVDPGEAGDSKFGPEGHCGFTNSIGTFSPRLRCAARADGTPATGDEPCSEADMARSLADATPPTDFSLRLPGAPVVVGRHLYIPDAGNARVLRLADFEEALKKCGRLLPAGDKSANDFCRFDLVIGQSSAVPGSPSDKSRFTRRDCVRGGERGGFDGAAALAAEATFADPAMTGGSGGAACRLDVTTEPAGAVTGRRRSRLAADFRDEQRSDVSPETGLLAESTRRRFRAPIALDVDDVGRLYVLDAGVTRATSPVGESEAVLPARILVWSRDPLSLQGCEPTDQEAASPSCSIDADGVCRGDGCFDRQCEEAECNASISLGQQNILYGFTVPPGSDIDSEAPTGHAPIAAFKVATRGDMRGVWAVTGRDARVLHWREVSQTASPFTHNAVKDETGPLPYRTGIFGGITVDEAGGYVTGWDVERSVGFSWYGDIPGITIPGEERAKIHNVSRETEGG